MATYSIPLGPAESLVELFSYPNMPGSTEVLPETISHWFNQTIVRDGFGAKGATASVRVIGGQYTLELDGPAELEAYTSRLPQFLEHGRAALEVQKSLVDAKPDKPWPKWVKPPLADKLWDPQDTGSWRFFLPFGMAMVNQKALNFFHYPPMRLLDAMRDYLDDPVPVRLIELMKANGIETDEEAWLYSTVMDGAPIAAPDDQGTIYKPNGDFSNPVHLIPIQHFHDYQRAQVELLLNVSETCEDHTVPMVVYGTPARDTFNELYGGDQELRSGHVMSVEIIDAKQTAVLSSGHPYAFYAQVQAEVGSGSILPEKWPTAIKTMAKDLVVVRWQHQMAEDPTQDPDDVLADCQKYWGDKKQRNTVAALALHQGSLLYPDPNSLQFHFALSLKEADSRIENT